jgi:tetratricopeptide (TPR) repeat protein
VPEKGKTEAIALPDDVLQISFADQQFLLIALDPNPAQEPTTGQKALAAKVQKRLDELAAKVKAGSATAEDRLNLSACQLTLGRGRDAMRLLQPIAQQYQDNPRDAEAEPLAAVLLANLATACLREGELDLAARYEGAALQTTWPTSLPGYSPERLKWYKEVEKKEYRLIHLRKEEQSTTGGKSPITSVDPLFDVQFVGEDGQYAPGKIAAAQKAKLPASAVAQVQQLLLWFPGDTRLLWLYGELLNARGDPDKAYAVLNKCVDTFRMGAPELKAHRLVLKEYLENQAIASREQPARSNPMDTIRLLVVGGVTGLIVLVLLYFQAREFFRRRRINSMQP